MATNTEEVVADEPVETKERSIREEIEAARDEINGRSSAEEPVEPQTENPSQESRTEGRARSPDGKFARAEGSPASDAGQVLPSQQSNSASVQQPDARGLSTPVALPPPQSWKPEEKAQWDKIPAPIQHTITRREQEAHRRITEQDEVRTVGNHFMQAANEFAPVIQARGGNPVALFREFLGIVNQIHNADPANRANIFRQLAAQNGVDLRGLGITSQPGAPPQGQPPNIPIDQLVQRAVNEQFQARQRQQDQERERAESETTNREIEAFRSKVDANGQPAYPYFDHVTSLMASILGGGAATTLEEAYQLAVKAHPETSRLIEQAVKDAARTAEEKRLKAQAARRKAGSIPPGVGNSPQANGAGNRTIRDELKAAFEEARGRV